MAEQGLTRNAVIAVLTKSPHGDLAEYAPIGLQAAKEDPLFFAKLIAWNHRKGAIRDAKVALPILALTSMPTVVDDELRENALAHVLSLDPRNLVRAVRFAKGQPVIHRRLLARGVEQFLRDREASHGRFERTALQHRGSLKELYALLHIKPGEYAQRILFKGEKLGVFADVARLKDMDPVEAAGTIMGKRIPFLVAMGALGAKAKEPACVQALIAAMSPTELVTNTKLLERLGMKTDPALRAAYEAGLQKAAQTTSTAATLKTTRAAEAVGGVTAEKLRGVQEKQLDNMSVDGDWLVIGDKSSSMQESIEIARQICAVLARVAKGRVHLVFFNSSPTYYEVTGKSFDEIAAITKRETAGGATSIGSGLAYANAKGIEVDGIVYASDGAENTPPMFAPEYQLLCKRLDKQVPVYLYWTKCLQPSPVNNDPMAMINAARGAGIDLQVIDVRNGLDFYSLPNLIATMRSNRFDLSDEIMATPLLKISDVLRPVVREIDLATA